MEKVFVHAHVPRPGCLRVAIEALSSNVRGDRNLYRQRPAPEGEYISPLDCAPDTKDIPGNAHASTHFSGVGASNEGATTIDSA